MTNSPFTNDALEILYHPEQWRLVSSWCPPDLAPVVDLPHARWMEGHSHAHPMREVLLTLTDGGTQGFLGQCYPQVRGALFLFEEYESHDFFVPSWAPDEDQLWLFFAPGEMVSHLVQVRQGVIQSSDWRLLLAYDQMGISTLNDLTRLINGQHLPPALIRMRIISTIALLVSEILARAIQQQHGEEDSEVFQLQIIHSIMQQIRATAGKGITLDVLAHLSGYSKYHLLRLFKQYAGKTIHTFIDECRLNQVQELLQQHQSKKQIAAHLGFSSPSAFSRWYRLQNQEQGVG